MIYYHCMVTPPSFRQCFLYRTVPRARKLFILSTKSLLLLCLLVQALGVACTERSRSNPLDPQNPQTGGKPTGLRVISELDTIRLSWNRLLLQDLSGFNVYRKLPNESDFTLLGQTTAQSNSYQDLSDRFGVLHSYRITARVGNLETPPSDEVTTTPGPTIVWVADIDSRAVIKLTHDGQHEILRSRAFLNPWRLRVDERRGNVWVLDDLTGDFGHLDQKGQLLGVHEKFFDAVGLALDPEDGSVWVAENAEHSLSRFDSNGKLLARVDSLPELAALAFNPHLQELWALTNAGEQLLRVEKNSARITRVELQPSWNGPVGDLAIRATTGEAWIAAGDRVVRLDEHGKVAFVSPDEFRYAIRVALDQASGACWMITDSRQYRNDSSVFRFAAHGTIELKVEGFGRPQSLAVNPYDASCYVLDTLHGRLVRISAAGQLTNGYTNFLAPIDIDIVRPER